MSGILDNTNDFDNKLIFIERTGHTYQQKHQEIADAILKLAAAWTVQA